MLHCEPLRSLRDSAAANGGGTPYGYGMESTRRGQNWYFVNLLRDGAPVEVRIDPATGKVLRSSAATGEAAKGANALKGSKLTLREAVAKAERAGNGRALEAGAAGQGSSAYVDVDVIQGHTIAHYRVSMRKGRVHVVKTATST